MKKEDVAYIQDAENDIEKKCLLVEPYWKNIKNKYLTFEEGVDFAYRILYQNPYSVYLSKMRR